MSVKPSDRSWIDVQRNTFTNWTNEVLRASDERIADLQTDLADGLMLKSMYEILTNEEILRFNKRPKMRISKLENLSRVLKAFADDGLFLVNIGAEDICDGNLKIILGLIWSLIIKYQIMRQQRASTAADANVSPKKLLLNWLNEQLGDYPSEIKDFRKHWQDGHAICDLVDSIKPGTLPREIRPPEPLDRIDTAMDKAETKLGVPRVMAAEDMLDGTDDLSTMTYISYFQEKAVSIDKGPNAASCVASGPGVRDGAPTKNEKNGEKNDAETTQDAASDINGDVADTAPDVQSDDGDDKSGKNGESKEPTAAAANLPNENADQREFVVELRNAKGEPIITPLNTDEPLQAFVARYNGPDDEWHDATVKPLEDGKYLVGYPADNPGDYEIEVLIGDDHIAGSPFQVQVGEGLGDDAKDDETDTIAVPAKCYATGRGLESPQRCGEPTEFLIVAVNANDEPIAGSVAESFVVEITPDCVCKMKNSEDGTCAVEYTPERTDVPCEVSITLNEEPIKGSPFSVQIAPDTIAVPAKCYATGRGLESPQRSGAPTEFVIVAVNANDEPIAGSVAEPFVVEITPNCLVNMENNEDGTYTVEYTPERADVPCEVSITLDGEPIKGSPFSVQVAPDTIAVPAKCYATGRGLESPQRCGEPTEFLIVAVNANDEPITGSVAEPFVVEIAPDCVFKMKSNEDGTYAVEYTPERPDVPCEVSITLNEEPIKDSPFSVQVVPVADPATTTAEGPGLEKARAGAKTHFNVYPKDKHGEPIIAANEAEKANGKEKENGENGDEDSPPPYTPVAARASDANVSQTRPSAGSAASMPPQDDDLKSRDGPPCGSETGGASPADTGSEDDATAMLAKKDSNLPRGGDDTDDVLRKASDVTSRRDTVDSEAAKATDVVLPFEVLFVPECDPEITQNPDGSYRVEYTPKGDAEGPTSIAVVVDGENIRESPFHVDVAEGADAGLSLADGPGLKEARVGEPAQFTVTVNDSQGRPVVVDEGEDTPFTVAMPPTCPYEVSSNGDGTFDVSYTPERRVPHAISLTVGSGDGKGPLQGSPFAVSVTGGANSVKSDASGPGLESVRKGERAQFTIVSRDADGKRVENADEPFLVGTNPECATEITNNRDGTYSVSYVPDTEEPLVEVRVAVYDHLVGESPYFVPVEEGISPVNCVAEGPGLLEVPLGLKGDFVVTAKDRKGEKIALAENPIVVQCVPECPVQIKDNGDGTYDVSYTAPDDPTFLAASYRPQDSKDDQASDSADLSDAATPIEIAVLANGEPISESPFYATVVPVPETVQVKECTGEPVKKGKVSVNTPSTVKAKLVDPETGKPIDGMQVTAVLKDENGNEVKPLAVGAPKKGKYPIEVLCEDPGKHTVAILVNGEPKEEFPVECVPETEAALVEGAFTFEVHARDRDGNLKTIGGEEWTVDVTGPNDSQIEVETTDHGDGRYSAKYYLAAIEGGSAEFKVAAKLNGRHVASSPFKHNLAPKPSLLKRLKKLF